jgi:hypothetical protein
VNLHVWLVAEYAKAQAAARDARVHNENIRAREGGKAGGAFHVSAIARMVALGQVLERLDEPPARMQTEPGA